MTSTVLSIDGPVISTAELGRQRELFEGVFGLSCIADEMLSERDVHAIFGLHDHRARAVLLERPGSRAGPWLVEFEPTSDTLIRGEEDGGAVDAWTGIDFLTSDLAAAITRLEACGFRVAAPPAALERADATWFMGVEVAAPDGLTVAILQPRSQVAGEAVRLAEHLFSEVQNCGVPVADRAAAQTFYDTVLGAPRGVRTYVPDAGRSPGPAGTPADAPESLRERARPPNLGIVAVRLSVRGLEGLIDRCEAAKMQVQAPAQESQTAALGAARTAMVSGPHGVWHLLVEPHAAVRQG